MGDLTEQTALIQPRVRLIDMQQRSISSHYSLDLGVVTSSEAGFV